MKQRVLSFHFHQNATLPHRARQLSPWAKKMGTLGCVSNSELRIERAAAKGGGNVNGCFERLGGREGGVKGGGRCALH
jgi:hypothetical protein